MVRRQRCFFKDKIHLDVELTILVAMQQCSNQSGGFMQCSGFLLDVQDTDRRQRPVCRDGTSEHFEGRRWELELEQASKKHASFPG